MQKRSDVQKRKVINLVQKRLDQVGHGVKFSVVEDGVRQVESWWYVPVEALRNGKDVPHEFAVTVYANIEEELETQHGVTVLFIPIAPDSDITKGAPQPPRRRSGSGPRRRARRAAR